MDKIGVSHCRKCGGTGKVFDNVPGSALLKSKMIHPEETYQPYGKECDVCTGTGHMVFELEE